MTDGARIRAVSQTQAMSTSSRGTGWRSLMVKMMSVITFAIPLACSARVIKQRTTSSGSSGNASVAQASAEQAGAGEQATAVPPPPVFGWCAAQPILALKCARCHGEPPEHGAPFSLTTYEDVQRLDSRGRPRYERMQSAIESNLMPATFLELEPPVEPLTDEERDALLGWLSDAAAPGDDADCPGAPR
jgi:hypothetical protein